MARNLARTDCAQCGFSRVKLEQSPRPITHHEVGTYFEEYEGMLVANAHCPVCGTKYLAWVEILRRGLQPNPELGYADLSYRSTFNDEPGDKDLVCRVETWEGEPVVIRLPKNEWDDQNKQVILVQSTRVVLLQPRL